MHRRPNVMELVDDDEIKLAEIKKHPFGIIGVYLMTFLGMMVAIFLTYILMPVIITDKDQAIFFSSIFSALVVVFSAIVVSVSTYIYVQSRLLVTDRNITQVLQHGLFSRKVSQLNIVNIEDVTSVQHGILSTVMNYGALNIETAGEQSNFNFTYCPNSNYYAKIILNAREKMLGQSDGNPSSDTLLKPRRGTINENNKTKNIQELGAEVVEHALDDK